VLPQAVFGQLCAKEQDLVVGEHQLLIAVPVDLGQAPLYGGVGLLEEDDRTLPGPAPGPALGGAARTGTALGQIRDLDRDIGLVGFVRHIQGNAGHDEKLVDFLIVPATGKAGQRQGAGNDPGGKAAEAGVHGAAPSGVSSSWA